MATDTGFGLVRLFDDFLGDTYQADFWAVGAATSGTAFATNVQVNGVVRGTVTNNSTSDASVIYGPLSWEADDGGPLIFECRIKPITSLSQLIFVGLSDEATTEKPLDYNGGSFTSTADDAVGFYYAGGETSATWRYGGTANTTDSDQAAVASSYNPVLTTYQTFRVVVETDGSASFYINGNIIAENISGCVTAGTALAPYISIYDDGAACSLDVDYVFVSKGRV